VKGFAVGKVYAIRVAEEFPEEKCTETCGIETKSTLLAAYILTVEGKANGLRESRFGS